MKLFFGSFFLILFTGCVPEDKVKCVEGETRSRFNLHSDFLHFKDSMENGDTLRFNANLSICTSVHFEENVFVKRNDKLYLHSINSADLIDSSEFILPEVSYAVSGSDSLSFECLFMKLAEANGKLDDGDCCEHTLIYHEDTVMFCSDGIIEAINFNLHYSAIKRSLYPDVELYDKRPPPTPQ